MELLREMKREKFRMTTFVFNTLIDAQARTGSTDEVAELMQSMDEMGCKPDTVTSSTIVKCYVVKGDLDQAFEVFCTLQRSNHAVDSVYNTILDGCTRQQRWDLADQLLANMHKYKVKPSNFTVGILVKMWGRRKQLHKAFEVIEWASQKFGLQPNVQVKTCLMCACLSSNNIDKAYQIFEEIKTSSQGRGVDAKSYTALIQGNVRLGYLEEAVKLVQEAYGLDGNRRALSQGQVVEPIAIEQLMRGLTEAGIMDTLGCQLLEQMKKGKIAVSGRLFSSMLDSQRNCRQEFQYQ
jgi:pentatricopeptide repeat protein